MITVRARRADLYQQLALLPAIVAGKVPDVGGMAQSLWRALGVEALNAVRESFIEKSRGGTGSDGIKWAQLSPRTVAYSRRHPGLNRKRSNARKAGRDSRPLLSASQDRLWRAIFARESARLRKTGHTDPSGSAAALAWAIVKRAGGKTILGQYGSAPVEILRDTSRLLNSFSPGHPACILKAEGGTVTVGTSVVYGLAHHAGNPKRNLPARPFWPQEMPPAWQARIAEVFGDGLQALTQRVVEEIAARGA